MVFNMQIKTQYSIFLFYLISVLCFLFLTTYLIYIFFGIEGFHKIGFFLDKYSIWLLVWRLLLYAGTIYYISFLKKEIKAIKLFNMFAFIEIFFCQKLFINYLFRF